MREDSIIIADAKAKPTKPEQCRAQLIELPFTSTAKELGTALMKIWFLCRSNMCNHGFRYCNI